MRKIALLLFLCTGFAASAQEVKNMTLEECINYALLNKDDIKNARIDEQISKAKNAEITGIALPQLSASGQFQYYIRPQSSFLPAEFLPGGTKGEFIAVTFTPTYNNNASVTASQILFDGAVFIALQARKTLELLSALTTERTAQDIRLNVSKAYYNVLVIEKQLSLLDKTITDLKKIADDADKSYKAGVVEKISVDQLKVQAMNVETDKIKLQNLFELSHLALKYQMGMPLKNTIRLTDGLNDNMVSMADLGEDQSFDYNNRVEFSLLNTQLKLNELDLKRYRAQGMPSLAAAGGLGYNYANNEFDKLFTEKYLNFSYVALSLKVPIFDGLQRRNRVKQAQLTIEKTKNSLVGVQQSIDLDRMNARTNLRNNLLALESQKKNVELAASVFDLAQRKFNEGVGSNLELVQAETSYLQAQSNYFSALNSAVTAKFDLQKSLGLLK